MPQKIVILVFCNLMLQAFDKKIENRIHYFFEKTYFEVFILFLYDFLSFNLQISRNMFTWFWFISNISSNDFSSNYRKK